MIDISERIDRTFARLAGNPALRISGQTTLYGGLQARVAAIQALLDAVADAGESLIGIATADSVDSYAAILAVLRSGRGFLPLDPRHPSERNARIVKQAKLRTILTTSDGQMGGEATFYGARLVPTSRASIAGSCARRDVSANDCAYLLFTSGSTGEPKGVPITRCNLNAFLDALAAAGCAMDHDDRVLQMFDPTFDFSIASYLAPLSSGACVYTVPRDGVKFAEIYRLLDEERITVAPMVPSVLMYLRPYFDDIRLPQLRLSFFCGEALLADTADAWLKCAPRGEIVNFYGPTEATVFAMHYIWRPGEGRAKALNGVVAIGQPMPGNFAVVVDEDLRAARPGEKGELCLAGRQITPGYWNDPVRNRRAFFEHELDGRAERFYRTGDVAIKDAAGDYLFCGRVDQQVKLQGYRVEIGEIEHHVRELVAGHACAVVPYTNASGIIDLRLVVEGSFTSSNLEPVLAALRDRLPSYMVPIAAVAVDHMPLSANGKMDRLALRTQVESIFA